MNLNAIIIAVGPPGSAKSWSGLRMGELVDPTFTLARVIFRGQDYIRTIGDPNLAPGAFVLWDDAGLGAPSREFWSQLNRTVGQMAQSSRFRRLVIWVTLPDRAFLDNQPRKLVNIQLEFEERRSPEQPASARVYQVSTSGKSDRVYYKHPRMDRGWGNEALEAINFYAMPSPALSDAYEKMKHRYMMGLYARQAEEIETGGIRLDDYHSRMILLIAEYGRALGKSQRSIAAKLKIREDTFSRALGAARRKVGLARDAILDEDLAKAIEGQGDP